MTLRWYHLYKGENIMLITVFSVVIVRMHGPTTSCLESSTLIRCTTKDWIKKGFLQSIRIHVWGCNTSQTKISIINHSSNAHKIIKQCAFVCVDHRGGHSLFHQVPLNIIQHLYEHLSSHKRNVFCFLRYITYNWPPTQTGGWHQWTGKLRSQPPAVSVGELMNRLTDC